MELILALLIGFFWLAKSSNDMFSRKVREEEKEKCNNILDKITATGMNTILIRSELESPEKRNQILRYVYQEMNDIYGEGWESKLNDFRFQTNLGYYEYGRVFRDPENVAFHLILAKLTGRMSHTATGIKLHCIEGCSVEESHLIIKKACLFIEQFLKEKNPDLTHELDFVMCKLNNQETVIMFRFYEECYHISDFERLSLD